MNFTQKIVPLNSHELNDLRKDFWQGWIGVAVIEAIGTGFTLLFSSGIPKASTAGFWFGLSPIILVNFVAVYIGYHLINTRRDIKSGNKILITGNVAHKFTKVRSTQGSTTLTSLYERTNHYIEVEGKSYLIYGRDYEICRIGSRVQMYVTPYGKKVYEIQFFEKSKL